MCKKKHQPQHEMQTNMQIFGTKMKHFVQRVFVCFWLRYDEVKLSWERRRSVMGGIQGNGEEGGSVRGETAVVESRKEAVDRVARYQTDYVVGRTCLIATRTKLLRLPRRCFVVRRCPCPFISLLVVFCLCCIVLFSLSHLPKRHDILFKLGVFLFYHTTCCLLYTSPSPRDGLLSRMPSSA